MSSQALISLSARDRSGRTLAWLARAGSIFAVIAVIAPVVVVLLSWGSDETGIWQHLIATQLGSLLRNTLVLLLGVSILVSLLGISLAWLTVMVDFPGRRQFEWMLMLPLAVPAYVLAFVVLGLFDFGGPVQAALSTLAGRPVLLDIRHELTVIAVMALVLYPYVYMLARSAFLAQSSDTIEAARSLGCGSWAAFFKIGLPMARPAIVAGVSLALMETLADFGTVSIFNYDTFTTAIYKAWFGFFSLAAAAQLASILLLFVCLVLIGEHASRGRRRFFQAARKQHRHRLRPRRAKAWAASAYCLVILTIGFFAPVIQLLVWAWQLGAEQLDERFIGLVWHTAMLAGQAALLTAAIALLIAVYKRQSSGRMRFFYDTSQLGYALPGTVLAVGVMLSFQSIEQGLIAPLQQWAGFKVQPLLVGGVLGLVLAYSIRFLAVASGPVNSALERIRPSVQDAARLLGADGFGLLRRVLLPMLRPGLMTALVLVFVDVIKEMPATLLLRPFGWDTLAVRVFEMTSEGEWQRAALPALAIVLVGMVPVFIGIRRSVQ